MAFLESERHQGAHTTHQSRYYITTLTGEAKPFPDAVRAHWGVENSLHWVLDVTFREDDCRIRRNNAPANLNTVRQISLNLIKKAKNKMSVKQTRLKPAWDDAFRYDILAKQ
uniref:Transposase DDE domain-containing protein n=1 Tax=Candidatus Kentrum eta TaxID=2126337 RepID=A0A450UU35_9GAMM|nr:MAG: Transposase DDE domain-containing protein [Candidatus Kentron sp. H]VFK03854.1 MAG: Transposase DDE domain-containing protein [Candidatus Kentron sp. H]